ncbi:MAG: hypothetical protein KBC81_01005 [Candidatus Pacebacteria bacterium]|nr:hypothetical protein [Candidatus Paceibacterota bacterium]
MPHISEERRKTFQAAWLIRNMMYQEGFWLSECALFDEPSPREIGRHKSQMMRDYLGQSDRNPASENRPNCEPTMNTGPINSIFSLEGLMVMWAGGLPKWMETPWGEWWCWSEPGPGWKGSEQWASQKYIDLFLTKVSVDTKQFARGRFSRCAIRQAGGVFIPQHKECIAPELGEGECRIRSAEWITLCQEMSPPRFPHWHKYVEADLPIPDNHPQYTQADKILSQYHRTRHGGTLRP